MEQKSKKHHPRGEAVERARLVDILRKSATMDAFTDIHGATSRLSLQQLEHVARLTKGKSNGMPHPKKN